MTLMSGIGGGAVEDWRYQEASCEVGPCPGCVKTPKGRTQRGILFYRRRRFHAGLPTQARTWRRRRTAFYVFCLPQRFDTAKTRRRPRLLPQIAAQQWSRAHVHLIPGALWDGLCSCFQMNWSRRLPQRADGLSPLSKTGMDKLYWNPSTHCHCCTTGIQSSSTASGDRCAERPRTWRLFRGGDGHKLPVGHWRATFAHG
jgi:hypothetical protein